MVVGRPGEDSNSRSHHGELSGLPRLKRLVDELRTPLTGCPWDLEQTPETLVPYLLEEAHEAAEALRSGDREAACGELGDLLLNVFLQARIAEERGDFTLDEIGQKASDKIVRRHPHVWGDQQGADRAAIRENWRRIKAEESDCDELPSVLRQLPVTLSALTRAVRSGADAARIGFDWPDWKGPLGKVEEELAEVRQAIEDPSAVRREIGDLLLAVTSLARHLKVDPEGALDEALVRFRDRFGHVEAQAQARGIRDLGGLEELWQEAKDGESGGS